MTFPLVQEDRAISAAPGARKSALTRDEAIQEARRILDSLAARGLAGLFARVLPAEPEVDPLIGVVGDLVNGRLFLPGGVAILPPSRRFDTSGHRLLGVRRYANGYTGFGLAPSEWRPGAAIWGFSESGLRRHEEYASPHEWLLDLLEPLAGEVEVGDLDLDAAAQEEWDRIEGDLLEGAPPDEPASIADGTRVSRRDGLEHEERHRGGLRHGSARAWNLEDDEGEDEQGAPLLRRGALCREGRFAEGFAEGPFRFYDAVGRPAQEVTYVRGFPHGRAIVHPEATRGLCDAATVEYVDGVPVSYTIPPYAAAVVPLDRAGAPPATLAAIAAGRAVLLLDCHARSEHPLKPRAAAELAELSGVALLGVGARPGRARLGAYELEVVADPAGKLLRAYGRPGGWSELTVIGPTGRPQGAGRLDYVRFLPDRLGL